MELGIVLTICVFIFTIIIYMIKSFYQDEITSLKRLSKLDQQSVRNSHFNYLRVLRREYANNILEPETLLNLDRKVQQYEKKVESMSDSDFDFEIAVFWKKYPDISDFDAIHDAPHFVKYKDETDIFASFDDYKTSESYLNIVKYIALLCRERNGASNLGTGTDLEYMKEVQHEYDKQRLKKLAIEAVRRGGVFSLYEDNDYSMQPLPITSASSDTWIHIKNTDEYIVHEFFRSDEGKEFNDYFYSNIKRETLEWLI